VRASDARRFGGLLLTLVVLAGAGCRDGSLRVGGPLSEPTDNSTMNTAAVKRGQFLVVGVFVPNHGSDRDVVLERLEPVDPGQTQSLEMRYAALRIPSPGCQIGAARGWLPSGCVSKIKPVNGFRVRRGADTEILVGARSQHPGSWSIEAFSLVYRVGDRRYQTTYAQGMTVRVVRGFGFGAGSRDIACEVDEVAQHVQCDISAAELKPLPPGCESGRAGGYSLGRSGATQLYCGQPLLLPPETILGPGKSWRNDGLTCMTRASGQLRCRNRSGHGFFLSRKHSYRF
jgi:hypothetical protein